MRIPRGEVLGSVRAGLSPRFVATASAIALSAVLVLVVTFAAGLLLPSCCTGAGAGSGAATSGPAPVVSIPASVQTRVTDPQVDPADLTALVAGNTAFALDMLKAARQATAAGDTTAGDTTAGVTAANLVFSPYSLSFALAMTYAGAAGQTAQQMGSALHFTLTADRLATAFDALDLDLAHTEGAVLLPADSVWVFPQVAGLVAPAYVDLLARYYGAEPYAVPGDVEAARQQINAWTADKTKGLVSDLLPMGSLPNDQTDLVLANALYFKASWAIPFLPDQTNPQRFHRADGSTVTVPMMSHTEEYRRGEDDTWTGVELAYAARPNRRTDGDLSMVLLLPKNGSLDQAVAATTPASLGALLSSFAPRDMVLRLPRFKFRSGLQLKKALQALGMVDAFDPNKADFSGMFRAGGAGGNLGAFVGDVYHGGVISVDESGTEAAAATDLTVVAGITQNELTFDRPFLFMIRHVPTGTILFLGEVMDPSAGP